MYLPSRWSPWLWCEWQRECPDNPTNAVRSWEADARALLDYLLLLPAALWSHLSAYHLPVFTWWTFNLITCTFSTSPLSVDAFWKLNARIFRLIRQSTLNHPRLLSIARYLPLGYRWAAFLLSIPACTLNNYWLSILDWMSFKYEPEDSFCQTAAEEEEPGMIASFKQRLAFIEIRSQGTGRQTRGQKEQQHHLHIIKGRKNGIQCTREGEEKLSVECSYMEME